jgi:MoxR-like ATPase
MTDVSTGTTETSPTATRTQQFAERIRAEVQKVIVGQTFVIDHVLIALLSGGHVLLEGVPGTAKTLLVKTLALTIQADYKRIQFTPDLMPSDVVGTHIFDAGRSTFVLKKGPIFSHLVLIDEVNRAPAKTQAALLEVMEERQVTIDGQQHTLPEPFMVFATQNPIEYEGTYALPEAQLDRFLFKILVEYPVETDEVRILRNYREGFDPHDLRLSDVRPVASAADVAVCRTEIAAVRVEDGVMQYVTQIVRKTRDYPGIQLGASPRAGVALFLAARARAAMMGRDYVIPEDVKFITGPVLRHRIILQAETELEGIRADEVLADVLNAVPVPR